MGCNELCSRGSKHRGKVRNFHNKDLDGLNELRGTNLYKNREDVRAMGCVSARLPMPGRGAVEMKVIVTVIEIIRWGRMLTKTKLWQIEQINLLIYEKNCAF